MRPEHVGLGTEVPSRVASSSSPGARRTSTFLGERFVAASPSDRRPAGETRYGVGIRCEPSTVFDAATGKRWRRMSERRQLALLLAPYVVGLIVLVARPALILGARTDRVRPDPLAEFVGLDNFRELVADDVFRTALKNSLVFARFAVPLRLGAALGLALLLHRRCRAAGIGPAA